MEDIDGLIESIRVRNFLCHDNLEVTLHKNINFIVGRNGSGKSAILTALVVGLGARASATDRGTSLISFIKKGTNSATVEIKIKNCSDKAYKHSTYGDSIIVIRHITSSGSSSYKIKSAKGEVISTKFDEVKAIVLAHDIQVDNPISVLNQEEARNFHAADEKKKYNLFRKATNLDQTENNYIYALENCVKAENIWKRKNEVCLELQKTLIKWQKQYDQLRSRDDLEVKKRKMEDEYYWSEIAEYEHKARIMQAEYDTHNSTISKLKDKLQSLEQNFGRNDEVIGAFKKNLEEKTNEKIAIEKQLKSAENDLRELEKMKKVVEEKKVKHRKDVERETNNVKLYEMEIANINSGDAASRREEMKNQLEKAEVAVLTSQARYDTAQHEFQQTQLDYERAYAAAKQGTAQLTRRCDELKILEKRRRELEAPGTDPHAVYGSKMQTLIYKIEEASRKGVFTQKPLGPVGAFLKVKEREWAGALEHIIKGSIKSFCVNTPEDSRRLIKIINEVFKDGQKPGVTCSKFIKSQHDVRKNHVVSRPYRSALDSLDIMDPVIANFLIDNVFIESILLVPDHNDAMRLASNIENVPSKCKKIIALDSTEYYPAPNYRIYGGSKRNAMYLQDSTAEQKSQVQEEIREVSASIVAMKASEEANSNEVKRARAAQQQSKTNLEALWLSLQKAESTRSAAELALREHKVSHHHVLVEELESKKEKLALLSKKLEEVKEEDDSTKQKLEAMEETVYKLKKKFSQISTVLLNFSDTIGKKQLELDQGIVEKRTCLQRIKENEGKLAIIQIQVKEQTDVVKKKTEAALKLCERVVNPREKTFLFNELKKLDLKMNSIRSGGLTKNQVADELKQTTEKHRTAHQLLTALKKLIDEVKTASDRHLHYCKDVQTSIASRVQFNFSAQLTVQKYSGNMTIDSARGTLELVCNGRESSGKRIAASTSSLSGGERSYATVAFIMALWECVELPFYFMDEFDVFMDNVNRSVVMSLLIGHASKNDNRQFVFLTPQGASSVTANPLIKIHSLKAPRG